ncbi:B12-binding domain-containing radical SAM protein [Desulfosediminicola sp.]|uniref:B12-binding domain-containing radical SAM protein n=1 Tax=Desulfosediminicola sp. TaxID=2886825 RepID=UPI003AF279E7
MNILLLHPPQAKPSEPPAGLPLLASALRARGCNCTLCDLNIEGVHYLLEQAHPATDTWSKRAAKNRQRNLEALNNPATYDNLSKYARAVTDINKLIDNAGKACGANVSLANYGEKNLSPLKSEELIQAAADYRKNLYYPFFSKRLASLIEQHSIESVGISLNFLSQALCSFAIIGYLREHYPGIRIILGGGLVTTWLQSPHNQNGQNLFSGLVDNMVAGPGENLLPELLGLNSQHARFCPDYSDFLDYRYLSPGFVLPYATSTGCFWRKCLFCPETSEQNPYHPVSCATVLQEVQQLSKQTSPSLIHFLDNAVSPAVLKGLADTPPTDRNGTPVPWYGFVRFTKQLADVDFCRRLRASGCLMLKLGLESGSQDVLNEMEKGIDLQLVRKVLPALHQAGIMTYVYLLFGTPGESLAEARQTMAFTSEFHKEITFLNLAIFNLPLGSPQLKDLDIQNFYEGDLSIYSDFKHPRGWARKEIRRFLDNEFRRDPKLLRILQNDPTLFTSNHAALFHNQLMGYKA